jgi:excisionase family DNA binding protein
MSSILTEPKTCANDRLLVDAHTAANMLSISTKTLWKKTKDGTIPCKRIGTRVLYSISQLQQWAEGPAA